MEALANWFCCLITLDVKFTDNDNSWLQLMQAKKRSIHLEKLVLKYLKFGSDLRSTVCSAVSQLPKMSKGSEKF